MQNGYESNKLNDLKSRIDAAADEGVLTTPLRNGAHDAVRILGNVVLHDDWREVTPEEYRLAHHYVQRILGAFYDYREEVEKVSTAKGRLKPPAASSQSS